MTIAQKFSIADLIDTYVSTYVGRRAPVSISDVIRAVKLAAPHCEMTDGELTNVIARRAILNGCSIFFGRAEEEESGWLKPVK
ncbi:MAG TPA: hypothetical protein VFT89_04155 [Rhizobiaceae bacterium]|nr:hypothetical protein [Rhizobiaceae bacterium]